MKIQKPTALQQLSTDIFGFEILDQNSLPIYIIDSEHQLIAVNALRARCVIRESSSLLGSKCYEAFHSLKEPCAGCRAFSNMSNERGATWNMAGCSSQLKPTVWEMHSSPLSSNEQQTTGVVVWGICDRSEAGSGNSIIEGEDFITVEELAARIEHEIKNPLTAIITNAEILKRGLITEGEQHGVLESILQASHRAQSVVDSISSYTGLDNSSAEWVDINETILEVVQILQTRIADPTIEFQINLEPELPPLRLNRESISHVWLNLILSAQGALHENGGQITIRSYRTEDVVHVEISDNGILIPPERIGYVLAPINDVSGRGRGTALGLAICQRTVQHHGGEISIISEHDEGTVFTISLPLAT